MLTRLIPVLLLSALVLGCSDQPDPEYLADLDQWHTERVERLQTDDGWLTLVGLNKLHVGSNSVGSGEDTDVRLPDPAPAILGIIIIDEDGPRFVTAGQVEVTLDSYPVIETPLATDMPGPASILRFGAMSCYVIKRGDDHFLRVKDNDSEVRRTFTGIDRFLPHQDWRVKARLEPNEEGNTVAITNALGQVEESATPGKLVFVIDGQRHSLIPLGEPGKPLFIVFGDQTNGLTTYGGGRFLSTDAPDADGVVYLDFNKATNPPCVFTPHATCPLPPAENRLPFAVEAGEKMWGAMH